MPTRVRVQGVGVVPFGRHLGRTLASLTAEAAEAALKDAGLVVDDIDVVFFSNSVAGITTGQEAIRGQTALREAGLLGKAIFNVENACASGSSAFALARMSLLAGRWRRALVVGAEKMLHPDRAVSYRALESAADLSDARDSSGTKSIFMEIYAEELREYMDHSGATREDFADVVVKNRSHATLNPAAQFRTPVTTTEVLESGDVVWPLTRFMCSPLSDRAAALVLGGDSDGPASGIEVLSSQFLSAETDQPSKSCIAETCTRAYDEAAVGPDDVDVVELHDAAAPAELEYYETLGFCPAGGGPDLLRSGVTRIGGRLPVNPGGGLVARGHPIGATGIAQLVEIVLQLRGGAGPRQVQGARIGMVQNAGGSIGRSIAASAVHILARS